MADVAPQHRILVQVRLRDQIAQALRTALASGELRPGTVHSAPVLAAEYGVSATPVREAMLDLAREGLVEPVRNKGFRIVALTEHDLDELAEIRALLEVPTVGRVTRGTPREQLETLRPLAEEGVSAARTQDFERCIDAAHRFHLELLALAGNKRLVAAAGELHRRFEPYQGTRPDWGGALLSSALEHLELLDLMVSGAASAAERCMSRHLGVGRSADPADGLPGGS